MRCPSLSFKPRGVFNCGRDVGSAVELDRGGRAVGGDDGSGGDLCVCSAGRIYCGVMRMVYPQSTGGASLWYATLEDNRLREQDHWLIRPDQTGPGRDQLRHACVKKQHAARRSSWREHNGIADIWGHIPAGNRVGFPALNPSELLHISP